MPTESLFRWICLGALVLSIGLSGYYRKRARQEGDVIARRSEEGLMIALRLLVTLPLLLTIVAYLVNPAWMAWAQVNIPLWLRWVGAALMLGAAPLVVWVLRSIGRNISETVLTKASHELVTSGPYRWVRHPLYTTGLILLTGLSLLTANAFITCLVLLIGVLIVSVVIPREEAALIKVFGERYQRYKRHTGRLLPSLHRKVSLQS
ncbi:MAG TPA: isoprenylcysteine carboxylmethyltransferase family protein [Rhodothermales bacterium]|nr:isoprenylcysteine carboxylmethyltransferase family protein [Rhodothermales bacterium]